ncbi:hypothetical protein GOP47_0007646 [Adiantum capillus-veneris]|uniref:Uncharacterized protein n=1 Tax=Adiantum capillus-veneris TaxID=13818 RepID=A0A9D4V1Y9_ADICA|nr:hypothetical protein GOP47_0007646 [Adiantum capillus-veneris]
MRSPNLPDARPDWWRTRLVGDCPHPDSSGCLCYTCAARKGCVTFPLTWNRKQNVTFRRGGQRQ